MGSAERYSQQTTTELEETMPNPKRRHSKQRTSTRRAHDALKSRSLSECPNCHERKLPHRVCPKCGYYKGREVLEVKAAGFVTAGNTGAAMATAKMVLGGLPGVDRPALAAVIPTAVGTVAILLDVGANVDCKPQNLEQFAVMGEIYFRSMFGTRRPRVGLLSIGQEEGKGNDLTREAFPLLKQLPLNFIGNVEGRDLYNGKVDVIVADGFVGNVALKTSEGVANLVRATLKESLKATITRQVGYLLSRSAFADFKKRLDHTEYGGAPLLGVKGVCFITHGSSNANAIKNAIRVAAEFAELRINDKIEKELAQIPAAVT